MYTQCLDCVEDYFGLFFQINSLFKYNTLRTLHTRSIRPSNIQKKIDTLFCKMLTNAIIQKQAI